LYNDILIADDEPFNVISLEGLINTFGVFTDKSFDGEQCLDKLE
jgi:CheY-like chemotaxis protein